MIRTTTALLLLVAAQPAPAQGPPATAAVTPANALPSEPQPLAECEVIARVNSEVILACELAWQVELMLQQRLGDQANQADPAVVAQFRREVLKQLTLGHLEMAMLYADFRSNAPGADLPSIHRTLEPAFEEREVPRLIQMVGVPDRESLEARLLELGTSMTERRESFYRTMIARSWLNQSIEFDEEVTHEQMLDYYHAHLDEYQQPGGARWEELMVRFAGRPDKRAAYTEIALLGNRAYGAAASLPADQPAFAALAKAESEGFTATDGGQYDWTTKGALAAAEVDDALFTLPPGQMSPILEGPTGFHIVRVLERREAAPTPFRDVQAAIRKGLNGERFEAAVKVKLAELKRSARLWTVFTGDLTSERLAELQGGAQRR